MLITGGAGFVAAHLARRFAAAGVRVRLADVRDPHATVAPFFPPDSERVRADVLDAARLGAAADVPGLEGIVHTAAVVGPGPALADPARATAVNVLGTQRVLDLARERGLRLTYLSTATLYGTRPDLLPLAEDAPPDPVSHYDATKLMGEVLVRSYVRSFGLDATVVRTGFVYGPGSESGSTFCPGCCAGRPSSSPPGATTPATSPTSPIWPMGSSGPTPGAPSSTVCSTSPGACCAPGATWRRPCAPPCRERRSPSARASTRDATCAGRAIWPGRAARSATLRRTLSRRASPPGPARCAARPGGAAATG